MARRSIQASSSSHGRRTSPPRIAGGRAKPRFNPTELGQLTASLAMWILLGIGVIVLIVYVGKMRTSLEKEGDIKACQLSIQLFTKVTDKTWAVLKPTMRCPSPHNDLSGDPAKLKQAIAESVRTCWHKTNGRQNGVARVREGGTDMIRSALGFQDSFCILCSSFTVDKAIPADEERDYMGTATMVNAPTQTYQEFLDTTFSSAGMNSVDNMFFTIPQDGTIPLPGIIGKMDRVTPLRLIAPGTTYYITNYNHKDANTVVVTTQADAGNLACDRFLQQREAEQLIPEAKLK